MSDSIDTNIVLRCILGDVPEQRVAAARLLKEPGSIHFLSNQAISECVYVMEIAEDFQREEVADMLNFFLIRYSDTLEYDREMLKIAFPMYLEHPKLSWTDVVLAAEAEIRHREPLFTFDKKLANQTPQAKLLA